jgi:hypothetical protein
MGLLDLKSDTEVLAEITRRWRELQQVYKTRNDEDGANDDRYYMRHWGKEGVEREGEERVTLATHTNTIDLGQGILTSQDFRIQAYPSTETEGATKAVAQVEKFLYGCLYVNNERQEEDIRGQVTFNQGLYGRGVIRTFWDWNLGGTPDPNDPNWKWEDLPIVIQNVNPKYVYPMPGGKHGPWKYLVYACKRKIADIEDEWGPIQGYQTIPEKNKQKEVEYVDYWGWEILVDETGKPKDVIVNAVLAGKEWAKPLTVEQGYMDIPYTVIPCKKTSSEKPEEQYLGMLYPIRDSVHNLERTLTKQNRAIKMFAYAPPVYKGPPGQAPHLDTSLGEVVSLPPGAEFGFMGWSGGPPDVPLQINILKQEVQEGSYPSVAYGNGPSMSGYAISSLSDGGRIRLQMPREAQELGWSIAFRKVLRLCQINSPQIPLTVWGNYKGQPFACSLVGEQMRDTRVEVSIATEMPADKARTEAIGMQMKAQGLLSEQTILEKYIHIDDPIGEIEQKMFEKLEAHPVFQLMRLAKIGVDKGIPKDFLMSILGPQLQQMLMQVGQQGQQPSPMNPGGGNPMETAEGGNGQPMPGQPQGAPPPPRPRVAPEVVPGAEMGQMNQNEMGQV